MRRYYLDLQVGGLSEWDDDGIEAAHIDDAITVARDMLVIAFAATERFQRERHAVVMIRDRVGNQIATLTGVIGSEPRIILPRRFDPE